MDIAPKGPERDRQIDNIRMGGTCILRDVCRHDPHNDCHDCNEFDGGKWSTDIATAFELAEDMRTSKNADAISLLNGALIDYLVGNIEIADAISGAWLKWQMEG